MTTNRERLAKMTNEELAEFFDNRGLCIICGYRTLVDCINNDCKYGILQWLNQESED